METTTDQPKETMIVEKKEDTTNIDSTLPSTTTTPSESTASETVATARTNGEKGFKNYAKIKKEFLIPQSNNPLKRNISELSQGEHTKERKKSKKEKQKVRAAIKDQICSNLTKGVECPYGDKCKFSHDKEKYLEEKNKKMVDGKCVQFEREGRCKFGIACLFGKDHIVDGKSIENPEKMAAYTQGKETCNEIPVDVQVQLKKRDYVFPKSMKYITENNIPIKVHYKGKQFLETNNPEKFKGQATAATESTTTTTTTTTTETAQSHENTEIEKIDIPLKAEEKKRLDFKNQLYLAPLTTVGNLPFRRICKNLGVDITCGEMALASKIVEGHRSELALLKRHKSEDKFGVQICGSYVDSMIYASEFIESNCDVDFIDINSGCPIDLICNIGAGSALMEHQRRMEQMLRGCSSVASCPLTIKLRIGTTEEKPNAHNIIPNLGKWGASAVTLHGRSRNQRYYRLANWEYIGKCSKVAEVPFIGNGDIYNYQDVVKYWDSESEFYNPDITSFMVARGALVKPWIFTEIKEKREWDISASERLDLIKDFVNYGLDHWGSDQIGVDNTRTFLLNWLSFTCRYVPIGILESQHRLNEKPPPFYGRSDLETLLASNHVNDWIKISEMFLGKVDSSFSFIPKHNSNSYESQG